MGDFRFMESKKFIVISSGHVLPESTIEQVGENLAKLYKKPSEKMIDKLVSGKSCKIKSVSTRAQAQSKCAHLSSLGLRCSFTEVGQEDNSQPSMYTRASYIDDSAEGEAPEVPASPEDLDDTDVGDEQEHSELFDEAIFDDVLAQAASGRSKKVLLAVILMVLLVAALIGGIFFLV